ncbi:MAG TPA: prepilin-type N-terminal cleavage/methylation domain-containing protein [Sedimenticola sp.]|nr:prepilin-type N-terminal cleavage/methylation domain-containing protein [Sedimenticola sp.]
MRRAGRHPERKSAPRRAGHCRGMTLVELMIALALSLLLAIAVVQLFIGNKKTFLLQESTARLQENGRFALTFIGSDIRASGYAGCISDRNQINNTLNGGDTSPLWGFTRVVQGFDASGAGWDPDWTAAAYSDFSFNNALVGTDILTLHTVDRASVKANQAGNFMSQGIADIVLQRNPGLEKGDIIFITDCDRGAITQITGPDDMGLVLQHAAEGDDPGNASAALGHAFNNAEVFALRATSYFVAPGAGGRPALWRQVNDDPPEELIRGVENMQVLYGVADDVDDWGTVSRYLTAAEVEAGNLWEQVAAVRIHLLLQSDNPVLEQAQTYRFNNTTTTADDRRVRREFTTTVGVRNRIL